MSLSSRVGWELTALGDVAQIIMGQAPPGEDTNHEGIGEVFVKAGEFGVIYPSVREWTTRPLRTARRGDVLICVVGATCGKLNLAIDAAIGRSVAALRPSEAIDTRFLWYQLMPQVLRLRAGAAGSAQGVLSSKDLSSIPLWLPPRIEQQRIVAAIEERFSQLDSALSGLRGASVRTPQARAAVLALAVRGELELRAAGECDRNSDGPWPIPGSWTWRPLGSLLREPLRNGHSAKATGDGHGVRTLTLTAVTKRDFGAHNTKLTSANAANVASLWLEVDDILIQRSNTPNLVGSAARYTGPSDYAIFPDLLIRVRVTDEILPAYLEIVLRAEETRRYFRTRAKGISGSMPKIDQSTIAGTPIPVPPVELQREIIEGVDERLNALGRVQREVESAIHSSTRLRRALLFAAFNGDLVPQDPTDEPASALLDRIRAERATAPAPRRRSRASTNP